MAVSVAKGTFTAPSVTGTQSITVGFQPKVVLLWHSGVTTVSGTTVAGAYGGFGAINATNQWAQAWAADDVVTAANAGQNFRTNAAILLLSNGTPTTIGVAVFSAFTSTQFTLNWTTASASTSGAIIQYLALGGADLTNVAVGAGLFATANGSASGPNVGFQPDALITSAAYQVTGATTTSVDSHSAIGFAANYQGAISQGACQYFDNDAANAMDCSVSTSTTACLITNSTATNINAITAVLTAFTGTGWTWTWSNTAATANMQYGYVALKGGAYKVVSETANTSNATKSTTGVGFTPVAAIMVSTKQSATGTLINSLPANTAELMVGAVAGANEGSATQFQFDGHADGQAKRVSSTNRAISLWKYTSATTTAGNRATFALCGVADITLQSDGWDAAWTSTDGTAYLYQTLVIGDTQVTPATGSAAVSLPALSSTATGTAAATGSAATSVPKLTATATGIATATGAAATTLPLLTVTAEGTSAIPGASGSAAVSMPGLTSTGTGTAAVAGTAATTLPKLTSTAAGTAAVAGTAAPTLPKLTSTATGLATATGTATAQLPKLSSTAAGTVAVSGSAAVGLPKLTATAVGTAPGDVPTGAGAPALPKLTSTASGTAAVSGSATPGLPKLATAATGTAAVGGTASTTLPLIVISGAGVSVVTGAGVGSLPRLVASAVGSGFDKVPATMVVTTTERTQVTISMVPGGAKDYW